MSVCAKKLGTVSAPIVLPSNEVLMEDMAMYAERMDVNGMMQAYLRRVLLEKPADPIQFLIDEITARPFIAASVLDDPIDARSEDVKKKFMDYREDYEKAQLLQELFDLCEKAIGGDSVMKAQMVVLFNSNPTLLLERFPKHVNEIKRSIDSAVTRVEGLMTLSEFKKAALSALQLPGGR